MLRRPLPELDRERFKIRLRNVRADLTIWERDVEGPIALGVAMLDPKVLGRVVESLASSAHGVVSISISRKRIVVAIDVLESWTLADVERIQRELQEAARLVAIEMEPA